MSEKLVGLIQKAANMHRHDHFQIMVGTVMSVDISSRTCTVAEVTGKGNTVTDNSQFDTDIYGLSVKNNIDQNQIIQSYEDSTYGKVDGIVHTNVELMVGVDDGYLIIPSIGSQVRMGYSDLQQPFVLQYSSISSIQHIVGDTIVQMVDGTMTTIVGDKGTTATQTDSKFNWKNQDYDMAGLIDKLLQYISAMSFTNGAGTTSPPNNLTDFQNLQSQFQDLLGNP